jgi:hypothetical protein
MGGRDGCAGGKHALDKRDHKEVVAKAAYAA